MEKPLNYYELLELTPSQNGRPLPRQEVKAAYRRALLRTHPDKRTTPAAGRPINPKLAVTVDDVALAYKTLSTPELKAKYDRWLRNNDLHTPHQAISRPRHTGLETVDLDDLSFDAEKGLWRRSCRCGDETGFVVDESELERNLDDGEVIVGCKGCSLWLRVLFGVEE